MDIAEELLDSWDRQSRIVTSVASLVNETNRMAKPSEDGWRLDKQLAHIHKVRLDWLKKVSPENAVQLTDTFVDGWETPIQDLEAIKAALNSSSVAVRNTVSESLTTGKSLQGYDHPVLFVQHMVWHEGWHVGLIFLGLRRAGEEPTEEWEEANVWGQWRTEEY